jgi:hypothetical protein
MRACLSSFSLSDVFGFLTSMASVAAAFYAFRSARESASATKAIQGIQDAMIMPRLHFVQNPRVSYIGNPPIEKLLTVSLKNASHASAYGVRFREKAPPGITCRVDGWPSLEFIPPFQNVSISLIWKVSDAQSHGVSTNQMDNMLIQYAKSIVYHDLLGKTYNVQEPLL